MQALLDRIERNSAEHAALITELRQIAQLRELGIRREDIVKQRRHTRYANGRLHPTAMADVILRDGTKHIVPANLLKWA
jgi:hypothetical protein